MDQRIFEHYEQLKIGVLQVSNEVEKGAIDLAAHFDGMAKFIRETDWNAPDLGHCHRMIQESGNKNRKLKKVSARRVAMIRSMSQIEAHVLAARKAEETRKAEIEAAAKRAEEEAEAKANKAAAEREKIKEELRAEVLAELAESREGPAPVVEDDGLKEGVAGD